MTVVAVDASFAAAIAAAVVLPSLDIHQTERRARGGEGNGGGICESMILVAFAVATAALLLLSLPQLYLQLPSLLPSPQNTLNYRLAVWGAVGRIEDRDAKESEQSYGKSEWKGRNTAALSRRRLLTPLSCPFSIPAAVQCLKLSSF